MSTCLSCQLHATKEVNHGAGHKVLIPGKGKVTLFIFTKLYMLGHTVGQNGGLEFCNVSLEIHI